jgi:protein-disulfide isomerase-like protein with CxxC motif
MKEKGIKGFPTFMLETADGENVEYQGPRTTDGWLAFLNEKLGGGI